MTKLDRKLQPRGQLTTRTPVMPANTNPSGDTFGGWVLSQKDIAAGICAGQRAQGRVATIAIDATCRRAFKSPGAFNTRYLTEAAILCVATPIRRQFRVWRLATGRRSRSRAIVPLESERHDRAPRSAGLGPCGSRPLAQVTNDDVATH
jgi:hypothetical protein